MDPRSRAWGNARSGEHCRGWERVREKEKRDVATSGVQWSRLKRFDAARARQLPAKLSRMLLLLYAHVWTLTTAKTPCTHAHTFASLLLLPTMTLFSSSPSLNLPVLFLSLSNRFSISPLTPPPPSPSLSLFFFFFVFFALPPCIESFLARTAPISFFTSSTSSAPTKNHTLFLLLFRSYSWWRDPCCTLSPSRSITDHNAWL